tara:strand:+ start:8191 stop:10398 length:2208 start_codon:yes stop_codon:yes gene_type:complete
MSKTKLNYKLKIDKKLESYLDLNKNDKLLLKDILFKNNAYIAGGFVLSAITDSFETSDIDIYINEINFNRFINDLKKLNNFKFNVYNKLSESYFNYIHQNNIEDPLIDTTNIIKEQFCSTSNNEFTNISRYEADYRAINTCNFVISSEYDLSFFKKNGIKFKIEIFINDKRCDIMIINKDRNLLDVVSNFDLTCCQLWYDGFKMDGTHLKDISNKITYLNPDYLESLLDNNEFIINRIGKYKSRGYKIHIPKINLCKSRTIERLTTLSGYKNESFIKKNKLYKIENLEAFAVKLIIDYIKRDLLYLISLLHLNYDVHSFKYILNVDGYIYGMRYPIKSYQKYQKKLKIFKNQNENITYILGKLHEYIDKLECNNICYLDIELNKIKNKNITQSYVIFETLVNYFNAFKNFTFNELVSNTYFYFGISINYVVNYFINIFTSNLESFNAYSEHYVNDQNLSQQLRIKVDRDKNMQKVLNMFKRILKREDEDLEEKFIKKYIKDIDRDYNLKCKRTLKNIDFDDNIISSLRGNDIINMETDINVKDYIESSDNNMCFINVVEKNGNINYYPYLVTRTSLLQFMLDKNSGWFYKCNRPNSISTADKNNLYIKIPFEIIIWINYNELCYILKNKMQIILVKNVEQIKHSVSHDLVYQNEVGSDPSAVSAKHCQEGSEIDIYEIFIYKNSNKNSFLKTSSKEFILNKDNININKNKLKSTKSLSLKKKSKSMSKTVKLKSL